MIDISNSGDSCGDYYSSKQKRKAAYVSKGPHPKIVLSDDEVRKIRELDKTISRQQIFDEHVNGKMTFKGMCLILDYITRCKVK